MDADRQAIVVSAQASLSDESDRGREGRVILGMIPPHGIESVGL